MKLNILCWLCHQPLNLAYHGICSQCIKNLPALPLCCPRCGLAVSRLQVTTCHQCQLQPPYWQHLITVTDYCEPLKTLIARLKFYQQTQLAHALSRLMLLKWLEQYRTRQLPKPDMIVPVPLSRRRRWQRGFNQTEVLAKPLATWLRCHYHPTLLTRKPTSSDQKVLSAQARKKNLTNIFKCTESLTDKNILLVDDIVTTGSTANEISRLLILHGARSVQIICLCRTL